MALEGLKVKDVSTLEVQPVFTEAEMKDKLGCYIDASGCQMINYNCDVYTIKEDGSKQLLAKFRKNWFPDDIVKLGFEAYYKLTTASSLRGAAAGEIDKDSGYFKGRVLKDTRRFNTKVGDGNLKISNNVNSGVIGYLDKRNMNNKGNPKNGCRLTKWTVQHLEKYRQGFPFLKAINDAYMTLVPDKYKLQKERADLNTDFRIDETAFSTVTINRNFRTGLHKDAGDFPNGFGNLTVIERGDYNGGYTIFPQYNVAFDVRTGDFLAMDVHQWHCNDAIYETEEQKIANDKLPKIYRPSTRVLNANASYTRLSFVCYLREKVLNCSKPKTLEVVE
jgi:hypothetical protein